MIIYNKTTGMLLNLLTNVALPSSRLRTPKPISQDIFDFHNTTSERKHRHAIVLFFSFLLNSHMVRSASDLAIHTAELILVSVALTNQAHFYNPLNFTGLCPSPCFKSPVPLFRHLDGENHVRVYKCHKCLSHEKQLNFPGQGSNPDSSIQRTARLPLRPAT